MCYLAAGPDALTIFGVLASIAISILAYYVVRAFKGKIELELPE